MKVDMIREEPIPQPKPPIKEVVLRLTVEEAKHLLRIGNRNLTVALTAYEWVDINSTDQKRCEDFLSKLYCALREVN